MEQAFKNMDELKDNLFEAIKTVFKDYEITFREKPESEFKVGDWITLFGRISRIMRIEDGLYYLSYYDSHENESEGKVPFTLSMLRTERHATEEEIEAHLKKICDKRYIGKRVKCLSWDEYVVDRFVEYDVDSDSMIYEGKNDGGYVYVYQQGEFAEIIPDKKKLPCSKEEARILLDEYDDWRQDSHRPDFLDEYE